MHKVNDDERGIEASSNPESTPLLTLVPSPTPKSNAASLRLLVKIYVLVAAINLAYQILIPAQTKIYESIYCWQWYLENQPSAIPGIGAIPEHFCKIPPVQRDLSTLKGYLELFDSLPGLLLCIPMGLAADYFGRRRLLVLNFSLLFAQQIWITFVTVYSDVIPLRAVWLEGVLGFVGGGKIVAEMLVCCLITDITPPQNLAPMFFRFNACSAFARVVGPILTSALTRINVWLAVVVGLVIIFGCVLLTLTLPETLKQASHGEVDREDPATKDETRVQHLLRRTGTAFRELGIIWTDWRLLFLALLYPCRMMNNCLGDLLQRYVSVRYNWTLADALLLYSVQATVQMVVLFVVLPQVAAWSMQRFQFSALQNNVVMARAAFLIWTAALTLEGLAPTISGVVIGLCIESLAAGLSSNLRAMAGSLVKQEDNGRVFSVLAISETLSSMAAYPATAALFNIGLEKGGYWLGLPYDVTAATAAVALVAMSLLTFES